MNNTRGKEVVHSYANRGVRNGEAKREGRPEEGRETERRSRAGREAARWNQRIPCSIEPHVVVPIVFLHPNEIEVFARRFCQMSVASWRRWVAAAAPVAALRETRDSRATLNGATKYSGNSTKIANQTPL
ncbi:hypothetical protein E2C01_045351 [Portunus trituberculatus]|uniref:Uncharacterized protein n=1 Tax=Portunus trituberculatus TaxID=210409 RepID=A0A5B7G4U2_PORTR|nr:hypothetical protein [Portunus trituberculatus]